jgi:hypothetical protein
MQILQEDKAPLFFRSQPKQIRHSGKGSESSARFMRRSGRIDRQVLLDFGCQQGQGA